MLAVFTLLRFRYIYALTLVHTVFTLFGTQAALRAGLFTSKSVPTRSLLLLAAAFVGYVVLSNLNLRENSVGFYQLTKIAVTPIVLAIEFVFYGKHFSAPVIASVVVVCIGVGLATVTDPEVASNPVGLLVGLGSILTTSLYLIWAGKRQSEYGLGSLQLLHQYVPKAAVLLAIVVLGAEPIGWTNPTEDTILGYNWTPIAAFIIVLSAVLSLMVNLSTFLMIGATSSLTFNVVGHVKTLIVLVIGATFFGDVMTTGRLTGIAIAMTGIVWYSSLKLREANARIQASISERLLAAKRNITTQ